MKEMVIGSSVDKIFMVMEYLENDLKYCMDQLKKPFSLAEVINLAYLFCNDFINSYKS